MNDGLKHPEHSGTFVREKGGWGKYHKWCIDNGYGRLDDSTAIVRFILRPQTSTKLQGRNEPCNCGSGKKFKKCCLNKT